MDEPWKLKESDERIADSKPTFIIFCEDKVSEPVYFKYFETALIKVTTYGEKGRGLDNVKKAIEQCRKDGIIVYDDEGKLNKTENDPPFIWCVFDRDMNGNNENQDLVSFDLGIEMADIKGINVAWSNDAFELWVLLHFEDVDINIEGNKFRKTYYDRLTEIYRTDPNPNEDLEKALSHASFGYKKDMKHKDNFRNIVRSSIIGNTQLAIDRAKSLENHFSNPSIPPHQKAPCTMVHHLVLELLKYGKKDITGLAV